MDKKIERFQENLILIRKSIGWSETEFGNLIGVTRQTINNLENKKTNLSKTQYIAMRAVINDEITSSKENTKDTGMVECLLETLIDNPEKYSTKERKSIIEKANMLSPAIMTKSNSRKEVSNEFMTILKALGIVAVCIVSISGGYFFKKK